MPEDQPVPMFTEAFGFHAGSQGIVALGEFYPLAEVGSARAQLKQTEPRREVRETRAVYGMPDGAAARRMEDAVRWTRCVNEFNKGRVWPLKLLLARLDPLLEPGIAIAVVPSHDPFRFTPPVRVLAQRLAANGRTDATGCLMRHARIARIVTGGPSTRALHRSTIRVEDAELIAGRRVLLLDDIVKSGASLLACRELLYEAGAAAVQALALARVTLRPQGP